MTREQAVEYTKAAALGAIPRLWSRRHGKHGQDARHAIRQWVRALREVRTAREGT